MTINFNYIPNGTQVRVPFFGFEVNSSAANTASQQQRALIIGQINSTGVAGGAGIATPNFPIISQGVADAKLQGGQGSMLARMTYKYRLNDQFGEVWYLPLADAGGAVAATGAISFTGPATANGTIPLYVAGHSVPVAVTTGMTAAQAATAVAAAINAIYDLPVTAAATSASVAITAKNLGLNGNDIDIRFAYYGAANGEAMPAGLVATVTAMSGGTTNPSLSTALANLLDKPFDFIVMPYTDTASLNAIQAFLSDATGRWNWQTGNIYGHAFAALRGTFGSLVTAGTARNDQHCSIMGFYDSPNSGTDWAAAIAGASAVSLRADPGLPLQTVTLQGILAPPLTSRFPLTERNSLLFDGISTFTVDDAGTVAIENLITTYQQNTFGQPDNSYLQVETMFTLMYVLRNLKGMYTTKYARKKLVSNQTRLNPGVDAVTPNIIRADIIAAYQAMAADGYVQNPTAFAAGLIVQQNASNSSRVDVLWDGILVDGLREIATLAQFALQ